MLLPVLLVGAPLRHQRAALQHRGGDPSRRGCWAWCRRSYLPNYREFYERRHFVAGDGIERREIVLGGHDAPFGTDLLFAAEDLPGLVVHAEICEDIWVPVPPSAPAALAGATVLANLSASNITIGKAETRRLLCQSQSARCLAAYLYAAAGAGESTTDLAWDGQAAIFENGVDAGRDRALPGRRPVRRSPTSISTCCARSACGWAPSTTTAALKRRGPMRSAASRSGSTRPIGDVGLRRTVERFPFVPADPQRLEQDCYEAYNIQVSGLAQRLRATGVKRVVIGVSGGLDSTQALIVAARGLRPAGAAAHQHPGLHDARLRHRRRNQGAMPGG